MTLSVVKVGEPMRVAPPHLRIGEGEQFNEPLPAQFALLGRLGTVVELVPANWKMTLSQAAYGSHHGVKGEIREVIGNYYHNTLLTVYVRA